MLFDKSFLKDQNDEEQDTHHLKTECREDQHFVLLPKDAFDYLHAIYEGIKLKRVSIELRTEEEDEGDCEDDE